MARRTFSWPLFVAGAVVSALALAVGCSSTPTGAATCTEGEQIACSCAGGKTGTSMCGIPGCSCDLTEDAGTPGVDSGLVTEASVDTPGDATHADEKPPPTAVYGECALKGSFGWPCSSTTSGPDPTDCTDPNFPDCFVGGQGSWCTASCATFGVCPQPAEDGGDAGCIPSACNARGYCK